MANAEILDSDEKIKKIDSTGMLAMVSQFPEMLLQAISFTSGISCPAINKVRLVVVAGMGGSAIAGDIVVDILGAKAKVPIIINRTYSLPAYAAEDTLLIALSYSGETEETVSILKEAEKKGMPVICITSGGKIKELADAKKYPVFLIPSGFQPRAALPFMLVSLLNALEKAGVCDSLTAELQEAIPQLTKQREEYSLARPLRNNSLKQLARKLVGKFIIISGAYGTTAAAALRLKNQFSENSKTTALVNYFPELNHNEMVNLSILKKDAHNFAWILLRDEADSERIKKRIEITKSLIGPQVGGVNELVSQGKSALTRILSLILVGDYLSVYLALLNGFDPTPVDIIARLKKELAR